MQIAPHGPAAIVLALICDTLTHGTPRLRQLTDERQIHDLVKETLEPRPSERALEERIDMLIRDVESRSTGHSDDLQLTARLRTLRQRLHDGFRHERGDGSPVHDGSHTQPAPRRLTSAISAG
jgi:hypothetical protein